MALQVTTFGEYLRHKRTLQRLTRQKVATAMGVSSQHYYNWEANKQFPAVKHWGKLANSLGVDGGEFNFIVKRAILRHKEELLDAELSKLN